jgi:hypothetical protein
VVDWVNLLDTATVSVILKLNFTGETTFSIGVPAWFGYYSFVFLNVLRGLFYFGITNDKSRVCSTSKAEGVVHG